MARGNFSAYGAKYKPRCRICMCIVKKSELVRINYVNPAHKSCAEDAGKAYSLNMVPPTERAAFDAAQRPASAAQGEAP
jgi:hypothetical protein